MSVVLHFKRCIGLQTQKPEQSFCTAGLVSLYEQKLQAIDNEMQVLAEIKARLLRWIRCLQQEVLIQQLLQEEGR